jgi:RNA polymerase sigma-70 factor (ECF subfamily)
VQEREKGDREQFTAVALPYMDKMYNAALYLCRDPDDAEELVQETFLRAYRAWEQFTPGTNCKAWLLTILHNTFRNLYRSQKRRPQLVEFDEALHNPDEPSAGSADPAELIGARVLDGEIQQALEQLPEEYLQAIVLVDIEELTYEEAAAVIGRPMGTVRSRLSRGRRLLQRALEEFARRRRIVG